MPVDDNQGKAKNMVGDITMLRLGETLIQAAYARFIGLLSNG
jgi:hypothetical protein